jgi:crossover junction endodeoxyribonuclease RuvC
MKIIGIDPGLNHTGWGVVEYINNSLGYIASGVISPERNNGMAERLHMIDSELEKVIQLYQPNTASIEETFVNKSGSSTIKLGMARGVCFLAPARSGLDVGEYSANHIKKSVVGAGHADKKQIQMMVKVLLPRANFKKADEADALAIAICHAHNYQSHKRMQTA